MSHLSEDRFDELVAGERAREHPPLNTWSRIAELAREEGLIHDGKRSVWRAGRPWMQAAAGIVILLGGIAVGRSMSSGLGEPGTTPTPVAAGDATTPATFMTPQDALRALQRAAADYQSASAFLAAQNTAAPAMADSVAIYRARLQALEQLINATEAARLNAPRDPVINQYYLATLGAHEATVQQLGAVQPASLRLKGF
ncbi:MAG TPA: hypothetical protein VNO75_05265 [Gemmatimonadaceae bacterium]|nr:hypothetical protein [Gemmatimonadaceae bacterium]